MEALNKSLGIGLIKNNGRYFGGSRKKITSVPERPHEQLDEQLDERPYEQPRVFAYGDVWQHPEPLLDVLKSVAGDTPLPELGGTYGWSVRYGEQAGYAGLGVHTLADYIDAFRQGDVKLPYLRHISLNRTALSIRQYIKDPIAFSPNWATSPWLNRVGGPEIFIGQAGTTFGHVHRDHLNVHVGFVQLQGEKEFILFPPDDEPYVYASEAPEFPYQNRGTHVRYADLQDYEQFPLLRKASPRRIVLRAGQALLMPANWWHNTYNRTDSVSYSIRIVNSNNIAGCIGEHLAGVPRWLKKLMGSE